MLLSYPGNYGEGNIKDSISNIIGHVHGPGPSYTTLSTNHFLPDMKFMCNSASRLDMSFVFDLHIYGIANTCKCSQVECAIKLSIQSKYNTNHRNTVDIEQKYHVDG